MEGEDGRHASRDSTGNNESSAAERQQAPLSPNLGMSSPLSPLRTSAGPLAGNSALPASGRRKLSASSHPLANSIVATSNEALNSDQPSAIAAMIELRPVRSSRTQQSISSNPPISSPAVQIFGSSETSGSSGNEHSDDSSTSERGRLGHAISIR
jgi:hypothetical protein